MPFLSIETFKEIFAETVTCSDTRLKMCLDGAIDELLVLVGQTAITDVTATTPSDSLRSERLVRAQGYLAYRDLLLNVSGRMRDGGIVKQEQDAGSPTGPNVLNSYMMPKEVGELRQQLYDKAMKAIAPYLVYAGDDQYDPSPESYHPTVKGDC